MSFIKIRHALFMDIKSVYEIEQESVKSWTIDQFIHELKNDFSVFLIAEINDSISGYIIAWMVADEIQLNSIAVKKNCRRSGIATELLSELCRMNRPQKYSKIYLEVRSTNHDALDFYLKNGFKKTGLRKKYYDNDDAVLMEKNI